MLSPSHCSVIYGGEQHFGLSKTDSITSTKSTLQLIVTH